MYAQFEEFQKLGKSNFEAAVANLGNTAKNVQVLATETTDFSKKTFQDSTEVVEKLATAKSLDKVFEIQTAYSKSAYENFVAYSTKVGEVMSAIAKDAVKPFEAAVAKASK
jgi:phasin family protein